MEKKMNRLVTNGIRITVEAEFQPAHSEPIRNKYLYVYHILIENQNDFPVQLLTRRWIIFEADGTRKEVKGEGVIGEQPIIEAGAHHCYNSFSIVQHEVAYMEGHYIMQRKDNREYFKVEIPRFLLEAPFKVN
jgi:ApaG protein